MGILNVTPDSFYDGGRYLPPGEALDAALRMVEGGADIIDVGGESTRPGAPPVCGAEERRRVVPVIEALARKLAVPISVDTYKADTARAALEVGATLVNDIGGLRLDQRMASTVSEFQAHVVIMHSRANPLTMQEHTRYDDLVRDVGDELEESVQIALDGGIKPDRIIVDPGIGFGKTARQNLELVRELPLLANRFPYPLLVGVSRKSFIGAAGGGKPPGERLMGTAAAVTASVFGGASILRVHDVTPMRQVVDVAWAIMGSGEGAMP